jgi:hypothetical protein
MFFLHDLNLDQRVCLPPVLRKDDLGVLKTLGIDLSKKKKDKSFDPELATEEYPLGEAPSWNDVERCIKDQPWKLMCSWLWSDNLGSLNQNACFLFQKFTTHIWTCLSSKWHTSHKPIHLTSLQDAIHCWTLDNIHAQIKSVSFIPCNADLLGNIPGRLLLIVDHSTFPLCGQAWYWKLLSTNPGYIAAYQEICSRLSGDDVPNLDSDISTLLSECQCLPFSIRISGNKMNTQQVIWKVQKQDILVLTNPAFYT